MKDYIISKEIKNLKELKECLNHIKNKRLYNSISDIFNYINNYDLIKDINFEFVNEVSDDSYNISDNISNEWEFDESLIDEHLEELDSGENTYLNLLLDEVYDDNEDYEEFIDDNHLEFNLIYEVSDND